MGKDQFVAVGEHSVYLFDSSLMELNSAGKKLFDEALLVKTVYPLNYTLILESDGTLTSIKWNRTNSPDVKYTVVIDGYSSFRTLDCLDDSTLCFIFTADNHILRFDIRTIHDLGITDPFYLDVLSTVTNIDNLRITDTGLKLLYYSKGIDEIGLINPITLILIRLNKEISENRQFKSIHSFLGEGNIFIKYSNSKVLSFRVDYNTFDINLVSLKDISSTSINDEMKAIRGTRYLAYVGSDKNIRFLWFFYNAQYDESQFQVINFVPASKPSITTVSSFDYY